VLETVLMLLELRQPPTSTGRGYLSSGGDWRMAARSAFVSAGRPLLRLAPTRGMAYYLDVLTTDAEEAFDLVTATPESVHQENVERMRFAVPDWLRLYAHRDPVLLQELDGALRAFHAACLAPRWPQVTARFHRDVAERTELMRRHGVITMLNTLSPDLYLRGTTLEGPYPWDRRVRLTGQGLVLMPSAFWTGHPLITWDPQDKAQHVLIYPARLVPSEAFDRSISPHHAGDSLGRLLGTTRATVLRALRRPLTTTMLARHTGISPASASGHAAALRAAGLITSERHGQAVIHEISELGSALLWHD
jgi:DNA-binding transcriptional ArsR family regulator